MSELYWYRAEVDRVVDGDTVDMIVDVGFEIRFKRRFRLARINAPEVRGPEKRKGLAAADFLRSLLTVFSETGLLIRTEKDGSDSFGRYIATLYGETPTGDVMIDINEAMVEAGHAEWKTYSMIEGQYTDVLNQLRDATGGQWDNIDPGEYIKEIREDDA